MPLEYLDNIPLDSGPFLCAWPVSPSLPLLVACMFRRGQCFSVHGICIFQVWMRSFWHSAGEIDSVSEDLEARCKGKLVCICCFWPSKGVFWWRAKLSGWVFIFSGFSLNLQIFVVPMLVSKRGFYIRQAAGLWACQFSVSQLAVSGDCFFVVSRVWACFLWWIWLLDKCGLWLLLV